MSYKKRLHESHTNVCLWNLENNLHQSQEQIILVTFSKILVMWPAKQLEIRYSYIKAMCDTTGGHHAFWFSLTPSNSRTMRWITLRKKIVTLKLDFYGDALKLIGYIKSRTFHPRQNIPSHFPYSHIYACGAYGTENIELFHGWKFVQEGQPSG